MVRFDYVQTIVIPAIFLAYDEGFKYKPAQQGANGKGEFSFENSVVSFSTPFCRFFCVDMG